MKTTIKLIGGAITDGKGYLPIRNYAASMATRARPKDYFGQVREVYNDFLKRWRYVRDPNGLETVARSPRALYQLVLGFNGGVGENLGAGDCDDAAAAMGALLESIGFPVRLATTAPLNARGRLFSHVFVQTEIPGRPGWLTVDPVGYPNHDLGWIQPHSRIAYWDLNGNLIAAHGIDARTLNMGCLNGPEEKGDQMLGQDFKQHDWRDFGFAGSEYIEDTGEPLPWDETVLKDFGSSIDIMGYMPDANHLAIEVDEDNEIDGLGNVRTPMLELSEDDYKYMNVVKFPYNGMMALGDDGAVYEYDGLNGFFKKLFKKAKKAVKKVAGKVKKGVMAIHNKVKGTIRAVLKKTKFGRWIIKIGDKIRSIAMKIVRPLMKVVGKWAGKLAPIAAMIPGYGTAIAGALVAAGKIAKVMQKFDATLVQGMGKKGKKSKVRRLKMKDAKKLGKMKKALQREAKKMKRDRSPERIKKLAAALKRAKGGEGKAGLPKGIKVKKKGRRKRDDRHLKAGTSEHAAAIKAHGVRRAIRKPRPRVRATQRRAA
jgi:hypothetical protein